MTRETDVRLLQYQDKGKKSVDQTVLGNSIPASAYDVQRDGIRYSGDIKFDINSGIFGDGTISSARLVEVLSNPQTPTTNPTTNQPNPPTNPTPNPTTQIPSTMPIVIGVLPVIITTPRGGNTTWYTIPVTVYSPMLKKDVKIIVRGKKVKLKDRDSDDRKPKDQKSEEIALDPEQVVYVDNTTQKTYVTVGLPSRVFPNFMGLEEVDLKKD